MRNLDILESWKEIADYLKKAERTCRRWEKKFGLPIHRMDGSPKARVFAYKHELDKWIQEMLHAADDSEKRGFSFAFQFTLRKALFPLMGAVALVIIALLIWHPWSKEQALPPQTDKPSLAIMYFDNNTGDEGLDHWRKALAELLIADISQSKYIEVLSGDRLFNLLRQLNLLEAKSYSSEDLQKIAVQGGANHILRGNYTKAGDSFRINVIVQNVSTSDLIGSERVEGEGEKSFFTMVDELTRRIKTHFKLSEEQITSDIDREVGKITTSSPEALNHFLEAHLWFHAGGDFRKSIQFLEKAVAIDPEFAMAYRKMGVAYNNLSYISERNKYTQKAFELIDRVSDRERYLIQGDVYRYSSRYDKAIETYKNLLQIYPEDTIGNGNLGATYMRLEEWDNAIERLRVNCDKAIQTKTSSPFSTVNLSCSYRAKGLYDKAIEILEEYVENIAENPIVLRSLPVCYICQGKYNLAQATAEKTISLKTGDLNIFRIYGDIFHVKGDLEKAEKEYQKLFELEEKTIHSYGRKKLTALYLLQGKFNKAKEQAKKGLEMNKEFGEIGWEASFHKQLAYIYLVSENSVYALKELEKSWQKDIKRESLSGQRWTLFIKGLAYIKSNLSIEAQNIADELKELIEEGMHRKHWRYYYHLLGMIELNKDNFSDAIDNFNKALTYVSSQHSTRALYEAHALFIEPLALAYYESGDIEKALAEYEKITELTSGRLYYGDIYAKSFYMLGKIHEQQGDTAKAIEHYEKFLSLWKDADPGIAEVADARKRLAGLKNPNNLSEFDQ